MKRISFAHAHFDYCLVFLDVSTCVHVGVVDAEMKVGKGMHQASLTVL